VGLGHVYCGRVARALSVFAIVELFVVLLNWLFAAGLVNLVVLLAVPIVAVGVAVAVAYDAFGMATRGRFRFHRKTTLVAACLLFVMLSGLVGVGLERARERNLGEPFRIPSGAMFPTLLIGDHFYTNQLVYRGREPRRGDVVIITVARDGKQTFPADRRPELLRERFVKRVVGVPGDRVAFDGAKLIVNGAQRTGTKPIGEFVDPDGRSLLLLPEALDGREYHILDSPDVRLPDTGFAVVEPGRYFVAGDNRDHSKDSRIFGTISREHLVAPTSTIYWSWDFNGTYSEMLNPLRLVELVRERTRWSRIGMPTN